jgi:hypothetical protein
MAVSVIRIFQFTIRTTLQFIYNLSGSEIEVCNLKSI